MISFMLFVVPHFYADSPGDYITDDEGAKT